MEHQEKSILFVLFCCGVVAGAALNLNCPSIKVFWRFIWNRLSQLNAGCAIEHFESMSPKHRKKTSNNISTHEKSKRQNGLGASDHRMFSPFCWPIAKEMNGNDDENCTHKKKASDFLLFVPFFRFCVYRQHDFRIRRRSVRMCLVEQQATGKRRRCATVTA